MPTAQLGDQLVHWRESAPTRPAPILYVLYMGTQARFFGRKSFNLSAQNLELKLRINFQIDTSAH